MSDYKSNSAKGTRLLRRVKKTYTPFPQAYRVISDYENSLTDTAVVYPSTELIQASKNINGVFCEACGGWNETGLDWNMICFLDDQGNPKNIWYCDNCALRAYVEEDFEEVTPSPSQIPARDTRYKYNKTDLDFATESPFKASGDNKKTK